METIAIMGILGLLGYSFAETSQEKLRDKEKTKEEKAKEIETFKRTMPSSTNIYNSDRVNAVNDMMLEMASNNFNESSDPDMSGILPPIYNSYSVSGSKDVLDINKKMADASLSTLSNINDINRRADVVGERLPPPPGISDRPMFQNKYNQLNQEELAAENYSRFEVSGGTSKEFSLLTGQPIEREHANMVPFFGSNVKQNVEPFKNVAKLDNYTGNTSYFQHKKEVEKFFENFQEDIHGTPLFTDKVETDRYIPSKFRQNEKPFYEEKISAPIAFTLDNPLTKAAMEHKTIDDLRVNNKAQVSYTAPAKTGQFGSVRGVSGKVQKNRVNMDFELGHDRLFTSVGAVTAERTLDNYENMPVTSRQEQNIEYYGGAINANGSTARIRNLDNSAELFGNVDNGVDAVFKTPSRQQLRSDHGRNMGTMVPNVNDYGKGGIRLPELERETTSTMHVINANKSGYGNKVGLQDTVKGTVKETTLHKDSSGNIKTPFNTGKTTAYEVGVLGNDAKTTQKETLVENKYKGAPQIKDQMGYTIANYNAKTTNKETTHTDYTGGASKQDGKSITVYSTYKDPVKVRNAAHAEDYKGASKGFSNNMNRDKFNNAEISETKERALMGARPSGAHNYNYAGGVNVLGEVKSTQNMLLKEQENIHIKNVDNIIQQTPSASQLGAMQTRQRTSEVQSDRIGNIISDQLKDNPYHNLR